MDASANKAERAAIAETIQMKGRRDAQKCHDGGTQKRGWKEQAQKGLHENRTGKCLSGAFFMTASPAGTYPGGDFGKDF